MANLTPEMRVIHEEVKELARHYGLDTYDTIFEVTINATEPTRRAAVAAANLVGSANVNTDCAPILGSEDFAHMAIARPGCFLFLGNGTEGAHTRPLHSADYDFNDEILPTGSSFWVRLVEQELATEAG